VYLAERQDADGGSVIATSRTFRPDLDQASHRAALASVEMQLEQDGWERVHAKTPEGIRITYRRSLSSS
jgi:hypothetical protein